ncbi:RNA-binding protein [Candidatus Pacearchaeota archaeon CG06_land_8_20_14_3_00_35_12]|nr:MAG: RNA-binding protein [Candidatus Pacearchaeota archaeon CG06_land_8_20_14_3_00_35_12]
MKMKCLSCKEMIEKNGSKFPCPKCKVEIARCNKCKKLSVQYKCKCGFEGP